MESKDLLYIEDDNKRKLFYRFSPATLISNFVPLIVILDEKSKDEIAHFEHKMWNVLKPIDNYGYKNRGSSWLGEHGDFFVKDLLQELIHEISEEYECEDHIYLYGNSIHGYGAILHGILCKANAVYVDTPYIRLPPKNDANTEMKSFYDFIFSNTISKEKDLSNFLNPTDTFPVFYLCNNGYYDTSTLKDEITYFTDACKKHDIKIHLDRCVNSEDEENLYLKKVLSFLERVASEG